ncbi:hypothetical protein MRB53_023203 [Persea americana]|uniref:Uncharacterized protein n=1 Tax=Persea americana TaxID=3435 RepID=A0ACC2L8X1_PERAE|nr:hypothetical protein MRB53_023203 [Persea americana]
MGMKGGIGYNGLRGKRLSLTVTALICTTILLWQWEKTPLFTVLSPQNQLEIISPVVVDGVQTLDHETDNEEDVKIKAVEKETKAEQGERNTEEHLNEPTVETRNDEAKNSGAVPMGFETARSPEKRDDGLTPPSLEKGCNYAKGQWVADSRRPLYSGFDC